MSSRSPEASEGWLAPEVERELPGLRLLVSEARAAQPSTLTSSSPPRIEARMRELSSRVRGARAIGIRREPVPAAYRVFFRHIGLDPDVVRTPIEEAVLERMLRGGFPTGGFLEDVLTIALMDTGVPVWALDADGIEGSLGVRSSLEAEALGRSSSAPLLPDGQLVVADHGAALAVLFGERAPEHVPSSRTHVLRLFAVQVAGVPGLYAEEALWSCRAALEAD